MWSPVCFFSTMSGFVIFKCSPPTSPPFAAVHLVYLIQTSFEVFGTAPRSCRRRNTVYYLMAKKLQLQALIVGGPHSAGALNANLC